MILFLQFLPCKRFFSIVGSHVYLRYKSLTSYLFIEFKIYTSRKPLFPFFELKVLKKWNNVVSSVFGSKVISNKCFKSKVWSLKILKIISLLSQWTYLIFLVNPETKSTKFSILRITMIDTWHSSHIVPRNPSSQRHFPHSHTPRSEQIVYKTKTKDWKYQ